MEILTSSPCPNDEELFALALGEPSAGRKAELQEHVRDCDVCREVLSEALLSLDEGGSEYTEELPRLERYELRRVIGSGGAGIVYLAFDPTLHREVAIKLLRPDNASSPLIRRRLLREARAMAKLSHPNVVTAYDVGESDLGVFIVLEYHPGGSLSDWLKNNHTLTERLERIVGAGRGLIAAHEQGIIHRDFKPQNVLIGSHGRTCVTDFGLAAFDSARTGARFRMDSTVGEATQTRGVLGTPSYMAPEVMAGEKADVLADQFSFCVTAYRALNGRHPFGATSGSHLGELIARIQGGMQDPSDPTLPPHIAEALQRGLSPDPGARFENMSALLDALSQKTTRFPAWLRWAAPLTLVSAVALGGIAMGMSSTSRTSPAPEPRTVSVGPPAPASGAAQDASSSSAGAAAPAQDPSVPSQDEANRNDETPRAQSGKSSSNRKNADEKTPARRTPFPKARKKATPPSQKKLENSETRYEDQLRSPY